MSVKQEKIKSTCLKAIAYHQEQINKLSQERDKYYYKNLIDDQIKIEQGLIEDYLNLLSTIQKAKG